MAITTRGQRKKLNNEDSEKEETNIDEMDVEQTNNDQLPGNQLSPQNASNDTQEITQNENGEVEMEDADLRNNESILGKRKTYKDPGEGDNEDDGVDSLSEQKREKMGLRARKRRNYSEENFVAENLQEVVAPLVSNDAEWETPIVAEPEKKIEWVPRVEKILAHRYNEKGEIEYYVKWKNQSYLHVSWVGPEEFANERYSKRKLIRYHKKEELLYEEGDEIFNPSFLEIDRIIFHYGDGDETEFLVKWEQMAYTEATWEFASDIKDDHKITEYFKRQKPPSPKSWKTKARPPVSQWKEFTETPPYKGDNQLRSYQLEGLNWLSFCWFNKRNSILADEMGLGKTVQTVAVLNHLYTTLDIHGPFLIVAPLITVPHWQREFEGWTDMNAVVYHGTAASRELIRKYEWSYDSLKGSPPPYKFNVLITTYEMILTDASILSKIHWKYLAVDEAHRLKNAKCKLINALRLFQFDHLLLLTGTPLQNNTEELWTLLNFMDPVKFKSVEEFSNHFGDLKKTSQVEELHEVLRPYLLRRMKEDVEKTIAPKEETIVEVELTTIQKSYYRAIFERNFSSLNMGAKASNVPSLLNIMMQLRKCCNHPYLLRGVEDNIVKSQKDVEDENELMINSCGKLVLVDKLLAKLKESGHKVLIFSQMIRMLDILEDYLIHKEYPYERIDGNKRGNERQEAIDRFSAPDSDRFVFLLCTRAGGLGINLTAADTCIIYDSDWNPQNDIQAQARCHRIGQTQKVKIYRLITRNTYEKAMFQKASLKLGLDQVVLTKMKSSATTDDSNMTTNAALRAMDKKEIEELLRFGAYKTFTEQEDSDEKFDEQDIDQILERNSTTIVHDGTSRVEDSNTLSSFSKASFISASAESNADLDVSDPDFWKKLLPGKYSKSDSADRSAGSSASGESKTRARYSLRDTGDRFPLYDAYLSSDDDGIGVDDDGDDNFDYGSGASWTSRERAKMKNSLSYYGYGQWVTIRQVGNLHRWSLKQIQAYADALILNCGTQISEDPHSLLKFLQKWSIYEPIPEDEPKDSDQFADFSLDPSLTDPNFSLYKLSNAKPFIRKLENIAKISKAVTEAFQEFGENLIVPPTSGEPPCSSWSSEDDRSLILGTYYHGYGRYENMRTDPRLSFSRFVLDPTRPPQNLDNMDDDDDDADMDANDDVGPPLPSVSIAAPSKMDVDKDHVVECATTIEAMGTIPVPEKEEWPSEKVLHRQLRKALRALAVPDEDTYVPDPKAEEVEENIEIEEQLLEVPEKRKKRYFSSHEWSKREKQAIYRYCVAFGIPEDDDEDEWNHFKIYASLTRKSIEQIQLYCEALIDTAEVIADKDRKGTSTDWSVQVDGDLTLTKAQSKRIVQRVRIFKDLRKFLLPRLEDLPSLLSSADRNSMPSWWIPSEHDYALIHGIIKHGFGQWEKLCADSELPFLAIAEKKMNPSSSSSMKESSDKTTNDATTPKADASDSDEDNEDDDEDGDDPEPDQSGNSTTGTRRRRRRGRKADVYTTAVNFPKEKGILKRLRYLIKFINDANLPPVEPGTKVITKRAPLKMSTDALATLSSPSSPNVESPRTNRKHKICAGRKPATKKYHEIPSHPDGSPIFPIVFGKMRIESLGEVVFERPNFHNDRYIWPVGYRSVRPYQSFVDASSRTEYTSEILDGGDRPLFQVTAADAPDRPGQGNSPTAAWTGILRKLNEKTNKPFNAVSGPEYFGLAKGIVSKLIQELPNADKCVNYQPQTFILDKAPQNRKKRRSKSFSNKDEGPSPSNVSPSVGTRSMSTRTPTMDNTNPFLSNDVGDSLHFSMMPYTAAFPNSVVGAPNLSPSIKGPNMDFLTKSQPSMLSTNLHLAGEAPPFLPINGAMFQSQEHTDVTMCPPGLLSIHDDPSLHSLPPMPINSTEEVEESGTAFDIPSPSLDQ